MAIYDHPIFFKRNRVFRVYLGGKLFHDFMGDAPEDGFYPEEWIASSVRAINPGHTDPLEGISILEENDMPFNTFLEQYKTECLGDRKDLGVLVKFLDSAIRLPMQVHPTRDFSKVYFNSPYGKAESWLILATREDACLYFGFSREVSREEFEAAVDASENDKECMTAFVNRVPVKTGDVFFVPAGVIHAIGAGCLLLEAQEPTDFTIQPEHWCGDYHLNDTEMFLGLKREDANSCFDFALYGDAVIKAGRKVPKTTFEAEGVRYETLIGTEDTPCFSMERILLENGSTKLEKGACVYICVEGAGKVTAGEFEREVKRGDYFFLPEAAKGNTVLSGCMTCVCCKGGN